MRMVTDGGDVTRLRGYEGEVERELGSCGGGGGELWAKPTEGAMSWVETGAAVYPRLVEFLHFDIQSTGQKSHYDNIIFMTIIMLCFN